MKQSRMAPMSSVLLPWVWIRAWESVRRARRVTQLRPELETVNHPMSRKQQQKASICRSPAPIIKHHLKR